MIYTSDYESISRNIIDRFEEVLRIFKANSWILVIGV